jgi:catechol 2,3-dioxygenase-like lactoylglutathione lyase family enzyme
MTMTFDHMVLLVHDLEEAVKDFRSLGFTVLERADTSHGSTVFRFVSFEDGSYILLTAFTSKAGADAHRLGPVLASGEGWADYSFLVPDAAAVGERLKAAAMPVRGPVEVSNVLAGGERWSLDLLMTGRGAGGDVALPFLVSDNEGRRHRIPGPSRHANGAKGIRGVRLSGSDPQTVAATLEAIGGTVQAAEGPATRIGFGDVWVDMLALADAPQGREGGGIVEVVLACDAEGMPAEGRRLDPSLSHGAPILLQDV